MFGGALDKVTGFLGQRLVQTSLLPSVAFWAAVVALAGGQVGWKRAEHWWSHLSGGANVFVSVVAVALLVLFALVLSSQEGSLISLYEGYWGRGIGRRLAAAAAIPQRARVARIARTISELDDAVNALPDQIEQLQGRIAALSDGKERTALTKRLARMRKQEPGTIRRADALTEFRYRNYPVDPADALATRLGNILKSAEQYPAYEGRYAMDAVFFWPRLITVVPDSVRSDLADARATYVLLLNVSTLALALSACAFGALIFAAIRPAADYWATGFGSIGLAYLLYRSALGPARSYGELVRSAFDLYRGDLLSQLKLAQPGSFAQERALWQNLGQMMYRGDAGNPGMLDGARAGHRGSLSGYQHAPETAMVRWPALGLGSSARRAAA